MNKFNYNLCPYPLLRNYIAVQKKSLDSSKQFFMFSDCSPLNPDPVRQVLRMGLIKAGLDLTFYSVHSLRSGRALDLLHMGVSVESIKKLGRWKSNAVFRYLTE